MGLIKHLTKAGVICSLLLATLLCQADPVLENPKVRLVTDFGDIVLELYPQKAPVTVKNFLAYVDDYHYDGVIFHRVVENFVIQTGGYGFDLYPREPGEPIINESGNGLLNKIGSVAMARLGDPDSAKAQFFINLNNNHHLNPKKNKPGYTVFGQVVEGMDVANKISHQPVKRAGNHTHLPRQPIMILKARRITEQ